ncbi:band 7 protein AGAP004871-like isoform X1 [Pecten maximus]|uniref:band 7 protein AGAP004871-like isoform X1 n=1 Tax=Pecten maximus TaxID=6579 RepID=UPI0014589774|nr:band 7 protein AGAP004871-like isoform X1 [Pecten maximus]
MAGSSGSHRSVITHRSFPGFHARSATSIALEDRSLRPLSHDASDLDHGDVHRDSHYDVRTPDVQDLNKFENNWEDLDAEFESRDDTWESSVIKTERWETDNTEMIPKQNHDNLSKADQNDEDLWDAKEVAWEIGKVEDVSLKHMDPRSERSETYKLSGDKVRADGANDGGSVGCCGYILWFLSLVVIACTFPFSLCLCIKVVQEYERAVIFRLGRLVKGGAKGPGLFFIMPCIDSYTKVDIRTVSFDVPPQEVLTKDSVTVAVDAVVYYRVQNATMSITNVEDANRSTRLLAATTLRNVLGTKNLSEILSERESISHVMQSSLDDATDPWGVKVERVEVKDVRLPVQLQRAMAAEAEAAREARAKVIAAEGEQKASRALKEAADVISESPAAIQLRYLQTLNTISAEKNSTIIFPLPIDLVQSLLGRQGSNL